MFMNFVALIIYCVKHTLLPRAFFKNSSSGGGGIYKKGPYYTDCGEITDGCWYQKVWCGIPFNSRGIWGIHPQKIFVFFYP
jgi:hypothetical protein